MPIYNVPNQYNGDSYDGPPRNNDEIYNEYSQDQMYDNDMHVFNEKIYEKATANRFKLFKYSFGLKTIFCFLSVIIIVSVGYFGFHNLGKSQTSVTNYCNEKQLQSCQTLMKQYQLLNHSNQYGYLYAFLQGGADPIALYVVKGNVFSVNNMIAASQNKETCVGNCNDIVSIQQSSDKNNNGVFGLTVDGTYFEWNGPYVYSAQPLSFHPMKIIGCSQKSIRIPGC